MENNIAVVVPTVREEKYKDFVKAWTPLFSKHNVNLITVWDGEYPKVVFKHHDAENARLVKDVMGKYSDLIYNFNDGVRNLGFAYVAKYLPDVDVVLTLDDDTLPDGDTIQDHVNVLNSRVMTSWMATCTPFPRGVPYNARSESEVVLSHGVWQGVKDWDAPTQLTMGNRDAVFYKGAIPKGVMYPMCGMNIAFKRKLLPYMYFAPMGPRVGLDRFADIWLGIESKKIIDQKGWATVTGHASVRHERASNVFTNLIKEAKGLKMNEEYGKDDYFKLYYEQRKRWKEYVSSL
jgi:reversibly glycosylated polypeptide/UDP-arabinopyranose mutase